MSHAGSQSGLDIGSWQRRSRAEGLANLYRISPNLMAINAQDVFAVNQQARDYELHEIPSVARIMSHPAVAAMVVMRANGDVVLEHYRPGHGRSSVFSAQSSTKSMGYVLLNRALAAGALSLDDPVEAYVSEVGSGFAGRTVGDVASMAVNHNVAELAAYTGDPQALVMFDRDERVIGLQRNDERETLRQFIAAIEPGSGGSTEWNGDIANYATINTSVLGLAIEGATKTPLASQVRDLLHEVGGEHTVYIGTDFDGVPVIGASLMSATVDFARFGRLLIEDPEQAARDRQAAQTSGQPVPAELTHVESRYFKSAIHNEYGLGHSGWGGQLLWADPESGAIIAANSLLASELPAPYGHFNKLYHAAIDIVTHYRSAD
ncbi:MAG: serine hydrolase domain-containing protein [Acidimicrobiales bacterium]